MTRRANQDLESPWEPQAVKGRLAVLLGLVVIAASGCVATQIATAPDRIDSLRNIAVVAVESPPLILPLYWPVGHLYSSSLILSQNPGQTTQTSGRVGMLVSGIFLLAELAKAAQEPAKGTMPLDEALAGEDAWIPTVILAREAADQIRSAGGREVSIVPGYVKHPRGVQGHVRLWAWFDDERTFLDHTDLKKQGFDGILEIGISNYEITGRKLLTGIGVNLTDPDGKVLGRGHEWVYYSSPPVDPEDLIENNGRKFKDTFATVTEDLVTASLKTIGLLVK